MPKKIEVPDGMAWCSKCKQVLLKEDFHKVNKSKTGVDGYCKICRIAYQRLRLNQKPKRNPPPPGYRFCPHCETEKTEEHFFPHLIKKTNLKSMYCRICSSNIVYREPRRNDPRGGKRYGVNHQSFKPLPRPTSTDTIKLAYAAGIFDGEGCAQIMPSNVGTPIMTTSSNNDIILNEFMSTVGGHIKHDQRVTKYADGTRARVSNGKVLICSLAEVRAASEALMPHLKLKNEKCLLLLKATEASPAERIILRGQLDVLNEKSQTEDFVVPDPKRITLAQAIDICDEEFSYLAGLIDAEGWIGILGREAVPIVRTAMTRSASVVHAFNVFGGNFGISPRKDTADAIIYDMKFYDSETWSYVLKRLAKFLFLKKKHAILIETILGMNPKDRYEVKCKLERLTEISRLEKFKRVKNQLPEFEKRIIRDENGTIVGIRDFKLEGDIPEIETEDNSGEENEKEKQQESNEAVQALDRP